MSTNPAPSARTPSFGGTRPTWFTVLTAFVFGFALAGLLLVQIVPNNDANLTASAGGGGGGFTVDDSGGVPTGGSGSGVAVSGAPTGGGGGKGNSGGAAGGGAASVGGGKSGAGGASASGQKEGLECAAGKNGGETDTGVTGDKIKLAANVVTDGPGANFLSTSPTAMQAVVNRVNAKGGICGRQLSLQTLNDSWEAARGQNNIQNFINEGYFALPVVPSSEGLSAAITAGLIENAGIPVIGTEGLRKEQYDATGKASWVGPVAVATVSQVRIMADYAIEKFQAKTFAIVYDEKYKFGEEGAEAYKDYLVSIGKTVKVSVPIAPNQSSYKSEADRFKADCANNNSHPNTGNGDKCDVVVFLLEPVTAQAWFDSAGAAGNGGLMTSGAQPLFNKKFAEGCGSTCNGMLLWTGYNPAIGDENRAKPGIAQYIDDLKAVDPSADETNQFAQGSYFGMLFFVELLEKCSPNLTRECIKSALNSTSGHSSDFTSPLTWTAADHFANVGARAYSVSYQGSDFAGFRDERTNFRTDPTPGVVP